MNQQRQAAVAAMIDEGLTRRQISEKLGLSKGTLDRCLIKIRSDRGCEPVSRKNKTVAESRSHKPVPRYFCRGCRTWVTLAPCMICEARAVREANRACTSLDEVRND